MEDGELVPAPSRARAPRRWLLALALAWLGLWTAQLAPLQVLLPLQVGAGAEGRSWTSTVLAFGAVAGVAGAGTLVASPLVGAASDRTRSRWGRRRPWVALGAVLCAAALALLGGASSLVWVAAAWLAAMVGFCAAAAALTASVADRVPAGQRGVVSTLVAVSNAVGIVAGTALVGTVVTGQRSAYLLLAGSVLVLTAPFVLCREPRLAVPSVPAPATGRAAAPARGPARPCALRWELASRWLVNLSNALGTTLLLYFFTFGLRVPDPTGHLVVVVLVYVVVTVAVSAVCGPLSDATGHRRPFVVVAGALQLAAAGLLALAPSIPAVVVAAVLLGAGWGAFMAVDQALVTEVVVDEATRARDLGVLGTAVSVPQNAGPLLAALLVAATGGFAGLFAVAAVLAGLGGLAVLGVVVPAARAGGGAREAPAPPSAGAARAPGTAQAPTR